MSKKSDDNGKIKNTISLSEMEKEARKAVGIKNKKLLRLVLFHLCIELGNNDDSELSKAIKRRAKKSF